MNAMKKMSAVVDFNKRKKEIFLKIWELVDKNYALFSEININWIEAKNEYLNLIEYISTEEELYTLIEDMLCELKDAHTRIYLNSHSKMGFYPITVKNLDGDYYIVDNQEKNSHISKGMKIKYINQMPIQDFCNFIHSKYSYKSKNLNNIVLLRYFQECKLGDSVKLTVESKGKEVTELVKKQFIKTIDLKAIKMNLQYLPLSMCNCREIDNKIGYIKILSFNDQKVELDFYDALNSNLNKKFLIIDIRDNQGGLVSVAKKITSMLLKSTCLIGYKYTRKEGGTHYEFEEAKEVKLDPAMSIKLNFKKIIILCNEYTSSSAEFIFLRALKNHHESIKIVGKTTAGLVHGATIYTLGDYFKIQLTTSKYTDTNNKILEQQGITPDIEIENRVEYFVDNVDCQLIEAKRLCEN